MTEPSISLDPMHLTFMSLSTTFSYVIFGLPLPLFFLTVISILFFTQSFPSFLNTCPIHLSLLCLITLLIFSMPIPSLSSAFVFFSLWYSIYPSHHSHFSSLVLLPAQHSLPMFTTTTTTVYFNEVVFPSVLGLTSPMAFPQHSPPSWPVPSIFSTKSLLSHIFFQHFSPTLPGPAFHSITIYLQCLNSIYPTQLISPLNMTKPPQPVSLHHFSNIINCQHAPHSLLFLSLKLTPAIYLNILISLLCIFLISSIFVGHVSLPYHIAGLKKTK